MFIIDSRIRRSAGLTRRPSPAWRMLAAATAFGASALAAPAQAQTSTDSTTAAAAPAPTDLWHRAALFSDLSGLRPRLDARGITVGLQETSEYLRNVSGGVARDGAYDGLTQLGVGVDLDKAVGLRGGTFNLSALQIHGTNLSQHDLLVQQNASNAEADATTRLWELWYQQTFAGGNADVKIGQQSLDQEFIVSQYAGAFINGTFGWPPLPAADLPGGGPAYPLSTLGARLRFKPAPAWTALAGVFDGNPTGNAADGDPQRQNAHGTNFNLHGSALFIAELQYALDPLPADGTAPPPGAGLPGTYKLGFWYDSQRFADPRFDQTGLSLANPAGTGMAARHAGDWSVYAVADQMVWRPSADSPRSVGVFARAMGAPGDRNVVDLAVNAGITLKAPFAGRDDDVAGLAVGYARTGSHARGLDQDTAAFVTPGYPVRSAETVIEATYQYQIAPWWQLQADAQYFRRPGGGIADPQHPGRRVGNELVLGMRTTVTF